MILEISTNATAALLTLRNVAKRQRYAIMGALNATGLSIQKAERERVARVFTLRAKREFILRQAAVFYRASVGAPVLQARVQVGQKPGLLLERFEIGGQRTSATGARNVAVPVIGGARASQQSNISRSLYLSALNLVARGKAIVGARGTFLVPNVGIFQRRGSVTRLLYALKPSVHLDQRLQFLATGRAVFAREAQENLIREVNKTLAYNAANQLSSFITEVIG